MSLTYFLNLFSKINTKYLSTLCSTNHTNYSRNKKCLEFVKRIYKDNDNIIKCIFTITLHFTVASILKATVVLNRVNFVMNG